MASERQGSVLAYDAGCGPCSGFKAVVSFLDARRRLRFVPLEAAEESGLLDGVSPDSRYASFHLGQTSSSASGTNLWSGAPAILPLTRLLFPWGGAISRLIEGFPPAKGALYFAYSTAARLHRGCARQLATGTSKTPMRR